MYWHYQHEAGSSTRVGSSDASDVFWSSRCKNNIRGFHESSPQKCTSYRILVRVGVLRWQSYSSSELPKRHLGWWKLSEWNMIQANPHPFSCPSRASLLRVKALRPSKILASNSTAGAPGAVPLANQGWAIASWLWKHRSIEASKHRSIRSHDLSACSYSHMVFLKLSYQVASTLLYSPWYSMYTHTLISSIRYVSVYNIPAHYI